MSEAAVAEEAAEPRLAELDLEEARRIAFREARRSSVSRETAEDIAQEALTSFDRLKATIRNAPAWLRSVVRRQVQERRGERARRAIFETLFEEPSIDLLPGIEQRHLLDSILARLRPRDSALLQLVLDGYSRAEIARALQVEPSSVPVRLARARERAIRARSELLGTVRHISPHDC